MNSKLNVIIFSYLLVIAIGILDYLSGFRWGFSIFALVPIILVTYNIGKKQGIYISIFSAIIWVISDYLSSPSYAHPLFPYWNAVVRLVYFITISYLLARVRDSLIREKEYARIDSNVGIANMRGFDEVAEAELERAHRYKRMFSVAYLDLDNFKSVNDTFGHIVGNTTLKVIAHSMQKTVRKVDVIARFRKLSSVRYAC